MKEHPDAQAADQADRAHGRRRSTSATTARRQPEPEWNIKSDIAAAQAVFASGVPLTVVPLDATATLKLTRHAARPALRRAHAADLPGAERSTSCGTRRRRSCSTRSPSPRRSTTSFCTIEGLRLRRRRQGHDAASQRASRTPASPSTSTSDEFLDWYVERVRARRQGTRCPQPPKHRPKLIERGGFPARSTSSRTTTPTSRNAGG